MGLLSDGGVHSNNEHLYSLLDMACELGVSSIRVHCFMDGRDVPPRSGKKYLAELEKKSFNYQRMLIVKLVLYLVAIMRWIATIVGNVFRGPGTLSG